MLHFLHAYTPQLWAGYEKNGLIGPADGIRFVQCAHTPEEEGFNRIAAKGGALWKLITEQKRPFYIDRLQGGCVIYDYDFDPTLLQEYRDLLGDKFLGFQMHEWMSNYRSDLCKCAAVSKENGDAAHLDPAIREATGVKDFLVLESMKMEEFVSAGKVASAREFYDNMTAIYLKRLKKYKDIVAADSGYVMYPFEIENGVNMIMPEIGANAYGDIILLLSYARTLTGIYGVKFGTYYECHGGIRQSTPHSHPECKNEWFIDIAGDPRSRDIGERGGSSRSLQKRIYLYSYLSGAEYISEEWGAYNTFCDVECTKLSAYGRVKKDFLDFARKYADIGDKVAPIAVVLPSDLPTYVVARDNESHTGDGDGTLYQFPVDKQSAQKLTFVRDNVDRIFRNTYENLGSEKRGLRNSRLPDAVAMLTDKEEAALKDYAYIVDLTGDADFAARHDNIISVDEVGDRLAELLPASVAGECHWMVNRLQDGKHYLTVFNHSGIVRGIEEGEYGLPEATRTVEITLKDSARTLRKLEGEGTLKKREGKYFATLAAGEFILLEF